MFKKMPRVSEASSVSNGPLTVLEGPLVRGVAWVKKRGGGGSREAKKAPIPGRKEPISGRKGPGRMANLEHQATGGKEDAN